MKDSLPRRLKQKLHKRLLNLVYALPRFQDGVIAELQEWHDRDANWAHNFYEKRKPPEGARIDLKTVRLVEVFDLDHHADFTRGLRRLFPAQEKTQEQAAKYDENAGSLAHGAWQRLGVITDSSRRYWFSSGDLRRVKELPEHVEAISVSAHNLLPSLYAVSFDIRVADVVSDQLRKVLDRVYLPEVTFKNWWPFGSRTGFSMGSPDWPMQREYFKILDGLRLDTARWLSQFVGGFFFNKTNLKTGNIPAVLLFELYGNPLDPAAFKEWCKTHHGWLDSTHAFPRWSRPFEREDALFMWPEKPDGDFSVPYRILVREPTSKDEKKRFEIFALDSLTGFMAVNEYVSTIRETVERTRQPVYSSLARYKPQIGKRAIHRALEVKHCLHLLDRVRLELQDGRHVFTHCLSSLGEFKSEDKFYDGKDLPVVMMEHLLKSSDSVRRHVENMEKALTDTINLQNVHVMIRLSRIMGLLALVGLALSVLQTIVNWDQLTSLAQSFWSHLRLWF